MDSTPTPATDQPADPQETTEPQEPAGAEHDTKIRPLRIWPPLILLALLWGLRIAAGFAGEASLGAMMARFMLPLALSGVILIWWNFASRALVREKLIGTGLLLLIIFVTTALSHQTVMGFGTMLFAIPWGMSAFAIGAIAARRWYPARTAIALAGALIAFGYWDLIRTDEVLGNFDSVHSWRWQPTAEDRFMQSLASRSRASTPVDASPQSSDESFIDPEWPAFRGHDRRGEQPGIVLGENWETDPPKEIWRVRVGPGWSSFSVAGQRLFTQEQRGDNEVVVCYSAVDGGELWVHRDSSRFWEVVGGAGPRGTPTIAESQLYALGANGLLNCLDPATGKLVW